MKCIKLTNNEYEYLTNDVLKNEFANIPIKRTVSLTYELFVSEEDADAIRDFLGERLQMEGFDKNYNLTQKGAIIEALIDKFFCV